MIGLERLTEDAVEEGMNTPFVKALIAAVREQGDACARVVLDATAHGRSDVGAIHSYGGRAFAYRHVLQMIENAGKESRET